MATKKKILASASELATLDLARAIALGDDAAAIAALGAGANPLGVWVEGGSKLSAVAEKRGMSKIAKAIEKAAAPDNAKRIPSYKESPGWWERKFMSFAAARGRDFERWSILQAGGLGTETAGFSTAEQAARFIETTSRRVDDAWTSPGRAPGSTKFVLFFGPSWNKGKRLTGFRITFEVDRDGWELYEHYKMAARTGGGFYPDPEDPTLAKQKDWEGESIAFLWWRGKGLHKFGNYIAMLRKGGSPFALDGSSGENRFLYHMCKYGGAQKAFLDRMRLDVGPEPGWHLRIRPWLEEAKIQAELERLELEEAMPKPDPKKRKSNTLGPDGRGL